MSKLKKLCNLVSEKVLTHHLYDEESDGDLVRAYVYNYPLAKMLGSVNEGMTANTALHISTCSDKPDFVRWLGTQPGVDVHRTNRGVADIARWTPLHIAARDARYEVVVVLIDQCGAQIDYTKNDGWTALHLAVHNWSPREEKRTKLIQFLIACGADVTITNDQGQTPLTVPMRGSDVSSNPLFDGTISLSPLQPIIDKEDEDALEVHVCGTEGWQNTEIGGMRILHYAARKCSARFFGVLADYYGKARDTDFVRGMSFPDDEGNLPLHVAARRGNLEVVGYLVRQDVNLDTRNLAGETALYGAACENQHAVCEVLMEQGADMSIADQKGRTTDSLGGRRGSNSVARRVDELFSSIQKGDEGGAQEIIKRNPTVLYLKVKDQNILQFAAYQGRLATFQRVYTGLEGRYQLTLAALVQERSRVKQQSVAAAWLTDPKNQYPVELKWLEALGLRLDGPHQSGNMTLLHVAAANGRVDVLLPLLEKLTDALDATSTSGSTALAEAASHGHVGAVDTLCKAGAKDDSLVAITAAIARAGVSDHIDDRVKFTVLERLMGQFGDSLRRDQIGSMVDLAIKSDCPTQIVVLLMDQTNFDTNWCTAKDESFLLLVVCMQPDNVELAGVLIDRGADVNFRRANGYGLLHYAATRSLPMVHLLVRHGASLTQRGGQKSLLPSMLVRRGASLTQRGGQKSRLPSGIPDRSNVVVVYFESLRRRVYDGGLLPKELPKAWLEVTDNYNANLVHFAASYNNVGCLAQIKEMCADDDETWLRLVNQKRKRAGGSQTPLFYGVISNAEDAITFLLQHDADLSIKGIGLVTWPITPFLQCLITSKSHLLSIILQTVTPETARALVNTPFDFDRFKAITPIQAAIQNDASTIDLLMVLLRAGADVSVERFDEAVPYRRAPGGGYPLWKAYKRFLAALDKGSASSILDFLGEYNSTWLKIVDKKSRLTAIQVLASRGHVAALAALFEAYSE